MFAIIKTGGKQYRVSPGDRIAVERLKLTAGQEVRFGDILLVEDDKTTVVGQPVIKEAVVIGEVEGEVKGRKLYPLKKKRRKNYRRRIGHRQVTSLVQIKEIKWGKKRIGKDAKQKGSLKTRKA